MEPIARAEPVRGAFGDPTGLKRHGLDVMLELVERTSLPPPIAHLTGMRASEASHGRATFVLPATGWLVNSLGLVPAGAIAFLADAPLSGSIGSALPAGVVATTSHLALSFVRSASPGLEIIGRAETDHVGQAFGLASGHVLDSEGRLVATGTTRCAIVPFDLGDAPAGQMPVGDADPDDPRPDPWQREPQGTILDDDVVQAASGLELLHRLVDGELSPSPMTLLTGFEPTAVATGRVTWIAPSSGWFCAPAPYLYGGALAWFAETALSAAASTRLEVGQVGANLDLDLRFLRPQFPNSGDLVAEGEVVHGGRRVVVARSVVRDAEGHVVVIASGSLAVLAGGVDRLRHGPSAIPTA